MSWHVLECDTKGLSKLIVDWSLENINPAMTPCLSIAKEKQ